MKTLAPSASLVLGCCLLALPGLSCTQAKSGGGPAPAAEKPKAEGELVFITLAPNEVTSLRIESKKIDQQPVKDSLEMTGWVMAKQGYEVTVTAPVAGNVVEPASDYQPPLPGKEVKAGQVLFLLHPVLSPVEAIQYAALKITVDTELVKADESLKLAQQEHDDLKGLVEAKVKQKQELDRIVTRLKHAKEDHKSALEKKKLFASSIVAVTAPRAGTVAVVHVSPGQYVPAAAPLVTVIDLQTLWVRVPVPEHDLQQVDRQRPATVMLRSARAAADNNAPTEERTLSAKFQGEVPLVDPTRHTVDLIYELVPGEKKAGGRGFFAKDLMVSVLLPLGEDRPESAVPYSAIVYDAHGGAWIYLDRGTAKAGPQQGKQLYERRGVNVGSRVRARVDGREADCVVVRPSLAAGERVVTSGAGILFSREFYKPPVNP